MSHGMTHMTPSTEIQLLQAEGWKRLSVFLPPQYRKEKPGKQRHAAFTLKRFGTGSTRMLDRGMLKPFLKQAKLAHCKPLALRIWAISDQL
jgi:predicted RNA binding protein YcfA (HicA-like mRNA interferase family)